MTPISFTYHTSSRWNERQDKGFVTLYQAESIQSKVDSMMTREGLILFALLAGGDYDKVRFICVFMLNCTNKPLTGH